MERRTSNAKPVDRPSNPISDVVVWVPRELAESSELDLDEFLCIEYQLACDLARGVDIEYWRQPESDTEHFVAFSLIRPSEDAAVQDEA